MQNLEKVYLSKLIELYRVELYSKNGDALFSKTKFGYILKNSTLVTICSFHTYQKLLVSPEAIKEKVYLDLLMKLELEYREASFHYATQSINQLKELYNAFLFCDFSKVNLLLDKLSANLSSQYIVENEYLNFFSIIRSFYINNTTVKRSEIEHVFQVAFLFPDELKIMLYDLCFRFYYTECSNLVECKKIVSEIEAQSLSSIVLEIDILIYYSYSQEHVNYIDKINQLIHKTLKCKNYNRAFDLYVLKLNQPQNSEEDKRVIFKEVEKIIQEEAIRFDKKFSWIGNLMIHYFDTDQYIDVVSLFETHMHQHKIPIILILLYYSSSHYTHSQFKNVDNEYISDQKPNVYYSLKEYFQQDLSIQEREKLLLSFYKDIPYNDSILNKIVYNEFMLYYHEFSKSALIRFIQENDHRIK